MMKKRWTIKPEPDEQKLKGLSHALNDIDIVLSKILIQRGIDNFEKAKDFFRPQLSQLHDPFLMKDMTKAVSRLEQAIEANEKILIYGDYDVDGTTAVALLYSFLENHYSNLGYYIPDRYDEGYGISRQGIDFAHNNNFSLIIALDCGIKANEKIDYANEKNIDFIICDHHTPGEELPNARAILDPKQKDCSYPYKELSGCGIAYKLIQAYAAKKNIPHDQLEDKLDILAVSICADIVPITGENRILTYWGLKKLNGNPQKGFKAMLAIAQNRKKELTVTDVVFTLAPRINAAGRIESGRKAVEAILAKDNLGAKQSVEHINAYNSERKEIDKAITEEALTMINADQKLIEQKTTVLFQPHWHKGVIGIVASRCIENYYRPTVILTENNGKLTGSARSVKGFNIYNALEKCTDVLEQFGGHKYAAGMTLPKENLLSFQEKFEDVVASTIPEDLLIPQIEIDSELTLSSINQKFYRILKQVAPFGPANMKPVFLTRSLVDNGNARIVGNNHLKLDLTDPSDPKETIPSIAFNLGNCLDLIQNNNKIDVVYTIEENEWNGNISLQLNIKDIRPSE